MVAVVATQWDFGGTTDSPGTTGTTITNLRFNNEDTNDQDTASPITIPTGGTTYSFGKHIYLKATTGPSVQIDNVKLYTDGTLGWTGCTVNVGDGTQTHTSGSTAGYDPLVAEILTNHDTITTQTSLFTYTSGAPRTVSISETSNIIDATNETTDYIVLNLAVTSTAVQGTQATETITWQYDEI